VHTARRGWVRRGEVLNALDADAFARAVRPGGA
jgi:DNA polymerase (family 10)